MITISGNPYLTVSSNLRVSSTNKSKLVTPVEPSMVIGFPNQVGDIGRYELRDQRSYFSKFDGGSCHVFELALNNIVDGDLLNYADQCSDLFIKHYRYYSDQCTELFDNCYQVMFDENTVDQKTFQLDKREFNRRIFDIYRFAKSSVAATIPVKPFTSVKKISTNPKYDSGRFLIK